MFDNLREKLGSFREDAEAAAEENVEDVDEDDLEAIEEGEIEAPADLEAAEADEGAAEQTRVAATDATKPDDAADAGADAARADDETEAAAAARTVEDAIVEETEAETGPEATEGPTDDESADEDDEDANATGFGRKARSLVRGKFVIEDEDLDGPLQELELSLLSADVEMGVAEELTANIRAELVGETRTFTTSTGAVVEEALAEAIRDVISVGQFEFEARIDREEKPVVIVFTGVNGVGKTTTIAKLSRHLEQRGYSTVLANGDTFRAGANEQIAEHADRLDAKLIAHERGGDPAAVLYDAVEYAEANEVDVVLGDTAGRLHTNEDLMSQLAKIDRVVDPDLTLFVDEAVAGQDAVNRAREFDEAAAIDGAILTKADADSNGGAAISIAQVTGTPILFLGVGQEYDDLERFDPDEMVDRLLGDD